MNDDEEEVEHGLHELGATIAWLLARSLADQAVTASASRQGGTERNTG